MSIEVNGVTLPDIPSDVLEQYPYAVIMEGMRESVAMHFLMCVNQSLVMMPAELAGGFDILTYKTEPFGGTLYILSDDSTAWVVDEEDLGGIGGYPIGDIDGDGDLTNGYWYSVIWSNHDIYTVTSANEDYEITGIGEIYFPSSVSHPSEYSIPHDDVVFLANKARAISGETGALGFADIKASFDNLYSAEGVLFG